VDESQSPEATLRGAEASNIGKIEPARISDNYMMDFATAVDEDSNLTAGGATDFAEVSAQGWGGELVKRDLAPIDALQGLGFGGA